LDDGIGDTFVLVVDVPLVRRPRYTKETKSRFEIEQDCQVNFTTVRRAVFQLAA
jgi:hypothetical protein